MTKYRIREVVEFEVEAEDEEEALEKFLADPDPNFIAITEQMVLPAPKEAAA